MGVLATISSGLSVRHRSGFTCSLPPMTAGDWLEVVLTPDFTPLTVVSMVLPASAVVDMSDHVDCGDLEYGDIEGIAQSVIAQAAGRPWWEAVHIVLMADASWESIGGDMAVRGIHPDRTTFGIWLDAALHLLATVARHESEAAMNDLLAAIRQPPPGTLETDPEGGTMDADAFMAAANELRGRLPG